MARFWPAIRRGSLQALPALSGTHPIHGDRTVKPSKGGLRIAASFVARARKVHYAPHSLHWGFAVSGATTNEMSADPT